MVVLIGPPGAGKSTVAAALAELLGVDVVDTDQRIEQHAGMSIADIFVDHGEDQFRQWERHVVAEELRTHRGVLALGGGAILAAHTQQALMGRPVVFLDVSLREAVRRTGMDHGRPLLALNPRSAWLRLMEDRRPVYERLARCRIDTSERTPAQVAEQIVAELGLPQAAASSVRISVGAGPEAYDVVVGRGLAEQLPAMLGSAVQQVVLVRPESLPQVAVPVREALSSAGLQVHEETLPDAEQAKTAQVAARLWAVLGQRGVTRSDAVVTVGGGSVTDLGGFVAATWLRGVAVAHVPTTLLGMVDAAIGGKSGINTAEGKNLVGAFYPPVGVLADLDLLSTLPHADLVAGLAEVIKGGFIADPTILDLIEQDPQAAIDPSGEVLPELVRRKIQVKADVVTADLKESSLREILNYGHTFAHAVEQVEGYTWRHGDAVAVGMVYAAELARLAGRLSPEDVDRHRRILQAVGLPTSYRSGRWDDLLAVMRRDKKARGSLLRFVVLDGIGVPGRWDGPDEGSLRAAYDAICQGPS
ncbi:3-dehydroquinate synthase [Austwickia sp. TVS 96-490-7B]|uniref:3-dehydroquinate synthase n=1 Tax=Austwickia sp. TVS 96-490-7B TaxID=2830843 RepID=UPI001C56FCBB